MINKPPWLCRAFTNALAILSAPRLVGSNSTRMPSNGSPCLSYIFRFVFQPDRCKTLMIWPVIMVASASRYSVSITSTSAKPAKPFNRATIASCWWGVSERVNRARRRSACNSASAARAFAPAACFAASAARAFASAARALASAVRLPRRTISAWRTTLSRLWTVASLRPFHQILMPKTDSPATSTTTMMPNMSAQNSRRAILVSSGSLSDPNDDSFFVIFAPITPIGGLGSLVLPLLILIRHRRTR